ncbi:SCO family protein [Halomonas sp. NO4]|uniref:SCO family protein n=1 Tax=Halomonas sp. NO4 TaxID=2484813 RepID=UPI0013D612D2|nr:SCO family protein [Halomonas sp. NO4]
MTRKALSAAFVLLVATLALGAYAWYQQQTGRSGEGPVGGPVELPSTQGHFSLEQLEADQLAVLFFGYTHCPDVCPMNMAVMRQVLQALDDEQRRRLVPVMVSVDPERDTLEHLEEYVGYFGEAFIGATGSPAQLEEIAERYGVVWRRVEAPDSAMGYTVDHTASLFLVDRQGEIQRRVLYSPTPGPLQAAVEEALGDA